MKYKPSAIYILFIGLSLSTLVYTPANAALSWADIKGAFEYAGSLPAKLKKFLADSDKVLEDKYSQIEGPVGDISKHVFSPIADTSGENAKHLGKISHIATQEGGKTLLNEVGNFASILKPMAETAGAWGADVPDEVGVAEAWLDFKGSGYFAAGGAAVGTVAFGPVGGFVGAYLGGVLYNLTGDKVTDAAGDYAADHLSNRTDADRRADRERINKANKRKKSRDRYYRMRCEDYKRDFKRDPRYVVGVIAPDFKKCLELGIDLSSLSCSEPLRWHKFLKKCVSRYDFFVYCKRKYPGSSPDINAPKLCKCPSGTGWSKKAGRCVPKRKQQQIKPSGKYARLCSMGKGKPLFVWDRRGRRYGCQNPRFGSKNFSARKTPIIVGVPGQVKGKKIDCPVSSWPPKTVRVKCVPKNARSPKPGRCATYHLTQINKKRFQKYCYYIQ